MELGTAHISDLSEDTRQRIREDILDELKREFPISGCREMYVTGSWVRGEAIPGASDLDVVVMVGPDDIHGEVSGTQEHFKNEFSPERCYDERFLFVDLWVEPGPPEERVVL